MKATTWVPTMCQIVLVPVDTAANMAHVLKQGSVHFVKGQLINILGFGRHIRYLSHFLYFCFLQPLKILNPYENRQWEACSWWFAKLLDFLVLLPGVYFLNLSEIPWQILITKNLAFQLCEGGGGWNQLEKWKMDSHQVLLIAFFLNMRNQSPLWYPQNT